MDRISKALEMARRESPPPNGGTPASSDVSRIEYTGTRSAPCSERVLRRGRAINGVQDERVTDAYRLLRTRTLHRMRQNGWRTLGITSAGPREGKTLTAVNLAISIAMGNRYTALLVDADLRRPSVHRVFGLRPKRGLVDHVMDNAPIEPLLVNPGIEQLVLLPGNPARRVSSEPLGSGRMEQLVTDCRSRYPDRIVLFDLPPVLIGDDVVAFAPKLDALLLVIEEGKTHNGDLARAIDLLEGVEIIGTVLNKTEEVTRAYGDYY